MMMMIVMVMMMMMGCINRPTRLHILTGRCQLLPLAINNQTAHPDHHHYHDHDEKDDGFNNDYDDDTGDDYSDNDDDDYDGLFDVPGHASMVKQSYHH